MEFRPTDHEDTTSVLIRVENCIDDIHIWMVEHKLKRNNDTTEVLILTSKLYRSIHFISQIAVGRTPIALTLIERNLGAMFDQSVTMDDFVKYICKAAYFHLPNSSSIRNYLLKESAITLACISGQLDSSNILLVGITETSLVELKRVQNMAGRFVNKTRKRDHITPIIKALKPATGLSNTTIGYIYTPTLTKIV